MKIEFIDKDSYQDWKDEWKAQYKRLSNRIHRDKIAIRNMARLGNDTAKRQKILHSKRMAAKELMKVLYAARERWIKIKTMRNSIQEQNIQFPLSIDNCRNVDFHFNKIYLDFPEMPMWVVKAKGKTYYVNHVTANSHWTTKETPDSSTKGMLRFHNCALYITKTGEAIIS